MNINLQSIECLHEIVVSKTTTQDSIPLLAPSCIDYSKVDPKCVHWVI